MSFTNRKIFGSFACESNMTNIVNYSKLVTRINRNVICRFVKWCLNVELIPNTVFTKGQIWFHKNLLGGQWTTIQCLMFIVGFSEWCGNFPVHMTHAPECGTSYVLNISDLCFVIGMFLCGVYLFGAQKRCESSKGPSMVNLFHTNGV